MKFVRRSAASALVVACCSTFGVDVQSASAVPPQCDAEAETCGGLPEPQPDDDGGGGDPRPPAQSKPPAPFGTPQEFKTVEFATGVDALMVQGLNAPTAASDAPPPGFMPFEPEVPGAPVRITKVPGMNETWAFSSFDSGGRPVLCAATCGQTPQLLYNGNYGLYQATMQLRPRLDIEIWRAAVISPYGNTTPVRLAEITATLHVRAFAECPGWDEGNAMINSWAGVDNVTIQRDTAILEDLANATFLAGVTSEVNEGIRANLMSQIGVGRFAVTPAHGSPCFTLGVRGDAADGAIRWNTDPCLTALTCRNQIVTREQ